ncbi:MAG: hypothetical protein GC162_01655 [Planctomycetes bacterium]|nr:hypothetical protein [Planctomycetota bacterium]
MHDAPTWNLLAAWVGTAMGMSTGAMVGLRFAREEFAGGYASWPRRLMRLGHISFFGLAIVNFMFYQTTRALPGDRLWVPSLLLIAGAVTMPAMCYLSAWRKPWRHLFFIPVVCLIGGVWLTIVSLLGALK